MAAPSSRSCTVLDLIEASYRNCPDFWDQEVFEQKTPITISQEESCNYPTVARYNRRENFSMFDLDTLFFTFYY